MRIESLFGWGIERMNGLGYRNKFALMSLLFLLPLGIALGALEREWSAQLTFSRQEQRAVPVLQAWGDVLAERLRLDTLPEPARDPRRLLAMAANADALTRRTFPGLDRAVLISGLPGRSPTAAESRRLIAAVGDASNLILDPDLDSYYLMEAVVVRIPEAFALLDESALLNQGVASPNVQAHVHAAKIAALLSNNLEAQVRGLAVAHSSSRFLSPDLSASLSAYRASVERLAQVLETQTSEQARASSPLLAAVAAAAETCAHYRSLATSDLGRLLQLRIERIEQRRTAVVLSTIAALLAIMYAWIAFYLGVRRTVRTLARTPENLRSASVKELTALAIDVKDELGQVAHAFIDAVLQMREEHDTARREATRAREAQAALRLQENRLRSLIDHSLDGIVLTNERGSVEEWNPAAEHILGWSSQDARGRSLHSLLGLEPGSDNIEAAAVGIFPAPLEPELGSVSGPGGSPSLPDAADSFVLQLPAHGVQRRDGRTVQLEVVLVNIPALAGTIQGAFFRDESERFQLEAQVRQAQKLESVGQIASGLAHEINTPVQYVSDSVCFVAEATTDLLKLVRRLDELAHTPDTALADARIGEQADKAKLDADLQYLSEQVPKALDRANDGLQRVAELVRSMKEFAHPDQKEMASIDINRVVQSTLTVARNEYKYVADVETDLADIPHVQCHGGEIGQVLLNLVVNAAHAISDVVSGSDRRGRITVRTEQDRGWVLISVTDTGGGVPDEIADRIFEPFFTTKEVGRGSGQGLAIAHGIVVRKHQGSLTFESEAGKGTTFLIRLPVAHAGHEQEHAA